MSQIISVTSVYNYSSCLFLVAKNNAVRVVMVTTIFIFTKHNVKTVTIIKAYEDRIHFPNFLKSLSKNAEQI